MGPMEAYAWVDFFPEEAGTNTDVCRLGKTLCPMLE